ncbi:DUF4371 domain-containing protein [Trichonephila clavipes]|nr:DUF4371 domain-containing protein [Trichonephila clavipes]
MAPWPRAPVIPQLVDRKTFRDNRWFTCRNCGGRGRVAIYRPFGEVSLSLNRTVTCMVLKANDRRTSCPCHDEFRGPRSDYVRQTEDYDLPFAMELLKDCKDFFKDVRSDTAFKEMLCDARELADEIDIPANFVVTQPRHRVRRRNVNFDYEAQNDPTLKYKACFIFSH